MTHSASLKERYILIIYYVRMFLLKFYVNILKLINKSYELNIVIIIPDIILTYLNKQQWLLRVIKTCFMCIDYHLSLLRLRLIIP